MRTLLRASVGAAFRRCLIVAGGVAAFITLVGGAGVELAVSSLASPPAVAFGWSVAAPVLVALGVVPLIGSYAWGRTAELTCGGDGVHSSDGTGPTSGDGVLTVTAFGKRVLLQRGSSLVASAALYVVASLVVGLAVAITLHAIVLSTLTAAGFVVYSVGGDRLFHPTTVFYISGVLFGLGISIGVLTTRFFDCFVCFTDAGPLEAVVESVRFTRSQPVTFLGYAVATTALFLPPTALFFFIEAASLTAGSLAPLLVVALGFAVTTGCFAVFGAFHVTVFEQRVAPTICLPDTADEPRKGGTGAEVDLDTSADAIAPRYGVPSRPLVANPVRLALVALLILALLAGSASIRAMDMRPVDAPEPGPVDGSMDSAELLTEDAIPVEEASHRVTQRSYSLNESTGEWEGPVTFEFEHDVEQRRMLLSLSAYDDGVETQNTTTYLSTKEFGMKYAGERASGQPSEPPDRMSWYQRTAGNWTVTSAAGYVLVEGEPTAVVSDEFLDQPWTVEERDHDEILLRPGVADMTPFDYEGQAIHDNSSVTVTLDRQTGYVTRINQTVSFDTTDAEEKRDPVHLVVEFEGWGTHEVDRPAEFGSVRSLSVAWAIAYY